MNFKKLKRLASVVLSLSMVLTTNMSGLASEVTSPVQSDYETGESCSHSELKLDRIMEPATDTEAGTGLYHCLDCNEPVYRAIDQTTSIAEGDPRESETPATNIALSETSLNLIVGDRYILTTTLTPENATTLVSWSVSDSASAVTITDNQDGTATVKADAATGGAVTITAKAGSETNSPSAVCTVNVYEHTHVYTFKQRKDSSCQEEGNQAYYICNEDITEGISCGRMFFTKGGEEITVQETVIPKKAHQPERHAATNNKNCVTDIPEHYYCSNCKRYYKDYDKFIEDSDSNSTCAENTDYWKSVDGLKNQKGHNFKYTFNWDNLNIEHFVSGKDNGVTVMRKCTNTGCGVEENAEAAKIKVTKELAPGYDCTQDGYATYTAEAAFASNHLEKPVETSEKGTKIVQIPKRDKHAYNISFSWDTTTLAAKADENNKLTFNPAGVTAAFKCSICDAVGTLSATELTVAVDDPNFDPEKNTLSCGQGKTIQFKATLRDKASGEVIGSETKPIAVQSPSHSLERIAARAATCDTAGNEAYFECKNCSYKFWDDNPESKPIDESKDSVEIAPLGHLFVKPVFDWENETKIGTAQATFSCGRKECNAKNIIIKGLPVSEEGTYKKPETGENLPSCGDKADISYPTSVEFDRLAVEKDENGKYYYNTKHTPMNPITYPSTVEREDTIDHEFEIAEDGITWNDTEEKYHDITQGITAIMTCKICSAEIAFKSTNGISGSFESVTGNSNITDSNVTGSMAITGPEGSGYEEATCENEGTNAYTATISCDTHEATAGIKTRYMVTKVFTTKTPASKHDYVVTSIAWLDNSLNEEDTEPQNVKVTLTCAKGDDIFTGPDTNSSTPGSKVSLAYNEITGASDPDAGNVTKTCTKDGIRAWEVTVTYDGDPVGSASQGKKLYVRKNDPAQGHDYAETETWYWENYGDPDPYDPEELYTLKENLDVDTAEVYAYYPCSNTNCDKQEDPDAGPGLIVTENNTKKWARKVTAKTVKMEALEDVAEQATCIKDGKIKYIAEADDPETDGTITGEKLFFAKATGHNWDSKVTWGEWKNVASSDSAATVYEITASVACKNTQCTLENDKKLTCTAYTDDRAVDSNEPGCSIQITKNIKPATCETSGWSIYDAKAVFVDPYKKVLIPFQTGKDTASKTDLTAALGHNYESTWLWKGIRKNAEGKEEEVEISKDTAADIKSAVIRYTSATVSTKCENEPDTAAKVETAEISVRYEGAETATCNNGVVAYYTAKSGSGKTQTQSVVIPPLSHNYDWKINYDWDEIDENTVGLKAVYGCLHEIPDDIWTNNPDPEHLVVQDVTVEVDKSSGPTCDTEGTIVWTLKTADGKVAGTHEETVEAVRDAHKIEVDWDTLKAADRKPDGTVIFELSGIQTCEFDEAHNVDVTLKATASFGTSGCKTPPQGDVSYELSVVRIGDAEAPEGADETIVGGTVVERPFTASNHKTYRVPATGNADDCQSVYYPTHYRCQYCGQTFTNSNMTTEITISKEPQGHKYGDPEFAWTADGRSANATFTCERCYKEDGENADDAKLIYTASVYNDMMNIDVPSKCTTWGTQSGNNETDGKGFAYYPVDLIFTEATLPKGLTKLKYEGELMARLPLGDHSFNRQGVCEYCKTKQADAVKVVYNTSTGITIREELYTKTSSSIEMPPTAPNQNALKFDRWTVNGETVAANQLRNTITGLLKDGGTITVTACYAELSVKTARVTVSCKGEGNMPTNLIPESKTETVDIGKTYTAKAEAGPLDANSKKWYFSHWASAQEDSQNDIILGYGTEYNVYVQSASPITIYAVYTETKPQGIIQPTVAMTNKYRSDVDGAMKVSFTATMNIPEGYTMVESGILYTTNQSLATDEQMVIGTDGVKKSMMNGTKANTFTAKVSKADTVVYTRGYLRYKNNVTNEENLIYTESIASGSYSTLPELAFTETANE